MAARSAQSARPVVGKGTAERHRSGGQPHAPHRGAPPGRRWAVALGVAGLLVLGACGSGGGSADVRCSGGECRATVTGTPVEVSEPSGAGSMALIAGTSTPRPKPTTSKSSSSKPTTRPSTSTRRASGGGDVDFLVRAIGPGWVEIDDDGVQRIAVGQAFAEDDRVVRVESADGRTAVFRWPTR